MIKAYLVGASGKMGVAISSLANKKYAKAITITPSYRSDDYLQSFANHDVIIDFSTRENSLKIIDLLINNPPTNNICYVSGVTGFSNIELEKYHQLALITPTLLSYNMSIGVNIVAKLCEIMGQVMKDDINTNVDVEVHEMHHRHKVDSPSGTAIMLAQAVNRGREVADDNFVFSHHHQNQPRKSGSIGFSALRGGSVIGDHSVIFAGDQDMIEISHKAQNREIFAQGAIKAALWLSNGQQLATKLYHISDMLDITTVA